MFTNFNYMQRVECCGAASGRCPGEAGWRCLLAGSGDKFKRWTAIATFHPKVLRIWIGLEVPRSSSMNSIEGGSAASVSVEETVEVSKTYLGLHYNDNLVEVT